ncbi:MAG: hypothetical protein PQJ61_03550 [Spirochaetales bacterium]|uniref:Uncharacterized protein n=1 Tax=Candidatus Thalassospirochaeta sargassi TaxID=3119039 RepID=A0AAJ1IAN3_9SPIO|nr:hypothetical protein [Spirochaetales bacterium]
MKLPNLKELFSSLGESLARVFSFSRKEVVVIISVISAVLIVSMVFAVIVAGAGKRNNVADTNNYSGFDSSISSAGGELPFLSDFMIDEDRLQESFTGPVFSREGRTVWSAEDIEKYWIDPAAIAAEHLKIESEKIIRDLFADVP